MPKYLGPLSSNALSGGSRLLYVSIEPQLDSSETLSTILGISSTDTDLNLSASGILATDTTTKDGSILYADKTIYFRASCTAAKTAVAPVTIEYVTNQSNLDSCVIYIKLVPSII